MGGCFSQCLQKPMMDMYDETFHMVTLHFMEAAINNIFIKISETCGLYYKTITIVIMMIVSDATIWSVTYDRK